MCSEVGKFSHTDKRSGNCEGECIRKNEKQSEPIGEVETYIQRPQMKLDFEWAIKADKFLTEHGFNY